MRVPERAPGNPWQPYLVACRRKLELWPFSYRENLLKLHIQVPLRIRHPEQWGTAWKGWTADQHAEPGQRRLSIDR